MQNKVDSCVSCLVAVTNEDVNGRQEQLKHGLLVTLLHLKTQPLQEAGWTFGTLTAAVLEATKEIRMFSKTQTHINLKGWLIVAGSLKSIKKFPCKSGDK